MEETKIKTSAQGRALPVKVKLCYSFGTLGRGVLGTLNTYFLLYFYTNVMEIPAAATTIILLIARIWDAVNDPMMGALCDRTRSKEGKGRYWLRRMAVPAGVCITLSYICPSLNQNGRIAWVAVTYLLQGMATTAVTVPCNTLMATMTEDRMERVKLGQWTSVVGGICSFLVPSLTLPFVRLFPSMQAGFSVLAVIMGVLFTSSMLVLYAGTRGYDPDTSNEDLSKEGDSTKKVSMADLIRDGLHNSYCLLVVAAYCAYLILSGVMGSTFVYYCEYNLQNENLMSVYSITVTIASFASILLMRPLCRKLGNAKTCLFGVILALIAFIPRVVTGDRYLSIFVISMAMVGFGSGLLVDVIQQCVLDSSTYGKMKTGRNVQSIVMSFFSFGQKFGQALGSVVASALMALYGYEGGEEPTAAVLRLFYLENMIIPMVLAVVVIIFLLFVVRKEKILYREIQKA